MNGFWVGTWLFEKHAFSSSHISVGTGLLALHSEAMGGGS